MTPGINLALRAYHERKGAGLALCLAERDYSVTSQGLDPAKQKLEDCREKEDFISTHLTEYAQAEVLMEILRTEE